MLSKSKIKFIRSLRIKKHREAENLFLVEGSKSVLEFINCKFTTDVVYGTEMFCKQYEKLLSNAAVNFELATKKELTQAGTLSVNNAALALVVKPADVCTLPTTEWIIALDAINDPGNLGTIIRIADWYGIKQIIVSENSVDVYNPKVVNASKGSLTRVKVYHVNLYNLLLGYKGLIIGADLQGQDLHSYQSKQQGVILMGSESHGISNKLQALLVDRVTIPRLGGAESLNVGVATAILCDNLIGRL